MAADIGQELSEQILKNFNEKYKKAKLFGSPISETLEKIKKGDATFRDADMYSVEVGTMMSEAITETVVFDDLPNKTMYYNIAKKIIEPLLQEEYNLISNVAATIQDDYNRKIGIGMKAAKPEFNKKRCGKVIKKVVKSNSQESFNAFIIEPVKTFAWTVVDDTKRENAEIHHKAGLKVTVTREYDHVGLHRRTKYAKVCSWCKEREDSNVPYEKAYAKGMFQRHDGCGCIIEYTSAKGEKTISTGKYTGWSEEKPKQREQKALDNAKKKKDNLTKKNKGSKIEHGDNLANKIFDNPELLSEYTPEKLKDSLEKEGMEVKPLGRGSLKGIPLEEGGGYRINWEGDRYLQFHPEKNSHHEGAYYKICDGIEGERHFKPDGTKF